MSMGAIIGQQKTYPSVFLRNNYSMLVSSPKLKACLQAVKPCHKSSLLLIA